jgi:hypothetical protein
MPRHLDLSQDKFAALNLAAQPLLPLLADLTAVPLGNRRIVPRDPSHLRVLVLLEELPPARIATEAHPLDLARLEGVHGDAAHKGNVDAEAAMHAGAGEADEDSEFGRCPLRRGRIAVAADVVLGFFLEGGQLQATAVSNETGFMDTRRSLFL